MKLVIRFWGPMLTVEPASCNLGFLGRDRVGCFISPLASPSGLETNSRCGMSWLRIDSRDSEPHCSWRTRKTDSCCFAGYRPSRDSDNQKCSLFLLWLNNLRGGLGENHHLRSNGAIL